MGRKSKPIQRDTSFLEGALSFNEDIVEDLNIKPTVEKETKTTILDELPVQQEVIVHEKEETVHETKTDTLPNILKRKAVYESKTFRIREDVVEELDKAFRDKKGKMHPGTKGLISKIATNALIKEMVALGILDKSYENKLESYD